jgi:hypothetical protein
MADGSKKLVRDVCVGDEVVTFFENTQQFGQTRVSLVTTDDRRNRLTLMAYVGLAFLTAGHPVCQRTESGQRVWRRPSECGTHSFCAVDYVYNFVVETRSSMFINDLEVCTLGQFCPGIDNDTDDNYFGSERVVEDAFKGL